MLWHRRAYWHWHGHLLLHHGITLSLITHLLGLVVGLLLVAVVHALWLLRGHSCPTLNLLVAILVVVSGGIHPGLTALALKLTHQHAERSDQRNHILVAALVLGGLCLVVDAAVPNGLLLLLARLFRLTVEDVEGSVPEDEVLILFGHSCRLSLSEAHEAHTCLRDQLRASDFSKVAEKGLKLLLGRLRVNIAHNQVQHLHAPLEQVSRPLQLCLALQLRFGLTNVELTCILLVCNKVVKSLLCVFGVLKTDKAELLRLAVCIPHDTGRNQLTKLGETTLQLLLSEVWLRKILHVQVRGAARLCGAGSFQFRHVLTD